MNRILLVCLFVSLGLIGTVMAGYQIEQLINDPIPDSKPDWSPDGSKIAFQSDRGESADIWVMDADGSNLRQLTTDLSLDLYASWGPDSNSIVFYSDRTGNSEIWAIEVDGTNERQITDDPAWDGNPAWGPDGRIVFSSTRSGSMKLWIMDPDGDDQIQLSTGDGDDDVAAWSPDGRYIVFESTRSGDQQLWKLEIDTGEYTRLTFDAHYERSPPDNFCPNLMSASWSPDGTKIAYHTYTLGSGDIWVMDADGSNKTVMISGDMNTDFYSPTWSPDGTKIAFQDKVIDRDSDRYMGSDIWVLDLRGKKSIPSPNLLMSVFAVFISFLVLSRRRIT
ncbi:MAG: DPP IV N-terminal domain-containing protein [ANME-2 cluster archaeon]|nr:DPP IV N-terminal domain-containing protein [ANME-2 cluster archaeon]